MPEEQLKFNCEASVSQKKQFTTEDVRILETQTVFQGFFRMLKYKVQHKLFAGGWSPVLEREIFERGHAVAVLLYDPVLQEFVLIEQFRLGAIPTSDYPWLLEAVAGIIEPGEDAEEVCRRETLEEAGLEILRLSKAISYLSSPGGTTERLHIYIGQVDAQQAGGIHGLDDEGEDIKVHRVPEQQALAWVNQGKIDNAASVIALQWFALNKQSVLNEWDQSKIEST